MILPKFPTTRFQGSKRKVLHEIQGVIAGVNGDRFLDLYSGSGIVTLLFRFLGKQVTSNDYLQYNNNTAKVFLSATNAELESLNPWNDLTFLLENREGNFKSYVREEFSGVYFKEEENIEIDNFCQNINEFTDFKKALYIYAVGQALIKKRPYNLFHRANLDMRMKDVKRSFGNAKTWETSIKDHAMKCIKELKSFPFSLSSKHSVINIDTCQVDQISNDFDLVYMDPPYINGKSVSVNYSNFYHFLEGLCDYSLFREGDHKYPHRPIVNKNSAWGKYDSACKELERICMHFSNSKIIMSYRSDGLPTPDEVKSIMEKTGRKTEIHSAGEYQYALSKNTTSEELFIVSEPS
ncbi:DNA adenine methylase [Serratia marcescens]|uniref:DNA adenine methylase n=1 Tax=Serratia marcescens TaxID=615 RepID=UPI0025AA815A|nr:DNA adenine methylase [Serratia marcescens]MDN0029790.1 DNA adenine methylase [Serratia marcescens]